MGVVKAREIEKPNIWDHVWLVAYAGLPLFVGAGAMAAALGHLIVALCMCLCGGVSSVVIREAEERANVVKKILDKSNEV